MRCESSVSDKFSVTASKTKFGARLLTSVQDLLDHARCFKYYDNYIMKRTYMGLLIFISM